MKKLLTIIIIICTGTFLFGQSEVELRTDGILVPSLTSPERDAIASPLDGHIIYNETTGELQVRESGSWTAVGAGSGASWKIEDLLDQNTGVFAIDGGINTDYVQIVVEGDSDLRIRRNADKDLRLDFSNSITTGNTFVGTASGQSNAYNGSTGVGGSNSFFGYNAGSFNNTGYSNTFVGRAAGYQNTDGIDNTFLGRSAGFRNTSGSRNTFLGRRSGYDSNMSSASSNDNTYVGYRAGTKSNSNSNSFVGSYAGENAGKFNNNNVFMGFEAGRNLLDGTASLNVAIGNRAGQYLEDGQNVMVGYEAGQNANAVQGASAATRDNVVVGFQAGKENTLCCNTYLGKQAGTNNNGSGNVFIGNNAGSTLTTTSDKLYIDNSSTTTPLIYGDFSSNRIGINKSNPGFTLDVAGVINGSNVACNGLSICSDQRLKEDFTSLGNVLEKISNINGYYHKWKYTEFEDFGFTDRRQIGFIAQEIQNEFPELIELRHDGYLMVDYSKMTAVLVEATKEMQKIIDNLQSQVNSLQKEVGQKDESYKVLASRINFLEESILPKN